MYSIFPSLLSTPHSESAELIRNPTFKRLSIRPKDLLVSSPPLGVIDAINPILRLNSHTAIALHEAAGGWSTLRFLQLIDTYSC